MQILECKKGKPVNIIIMLHSHRDQVLVQERTTKKVWDLNPKPQGWWGLTCTSDLTSCLCSKDNILKRAYIGLTVNWCILDFLVPNGMCQLLDLILARLVLLIDCSWYLSCGAKAGKWLTAAINCWLTLIGTSSLKLARQKGKHPTCTCILVSTT